MSADTNTQKTAFFVNIVLPSALAVILFVATLFIFVIPSFENTLLDKKREMIKELTNAATSILDKYHKDETDSLLSRESAQQTAISRIQYLRYGEENKDYFWITDLRPFMVMHPYRPELNGTDLSDFRDSHGKKLFVESVQIARRDGMGYVDYMWQWKDDSTHVVPKLSFVKYFEPWGWIVGTGIYIEDVKKEIASLSQKFVRISIVISLITALLLYYIGRQSLRIERKRRKAEKDLHASREKYKTLVEASTEGLVMLIEGRISFANSIFLKMTGYSGTEIPSVNITDVLDIPAQTIDAISKAPMTFSDKPRELHLRTKDGQVSDVLVTISGALFNDIETAIVSVKDVSSDKMIRTALLQSREKFKTLMDKLNMGIFRTTIDTKGRFTEANETALKILGFKNFEDLSRIYILDLFTDIEDKKTFRNNLIEKGFIKNQVLKLRRNNGQIAVVTVSLVVISGTGNTPEFCDGIIEDVSLPDRSDTQNDTLIKEYVSFTQLYMQSISNLAKKVVAVHFNDKIRTMLQKMADNNVSEVFVTDGTEGILGYITDTDIRLRLTGTSRTTDSKVFEIMTSPVLTINAQEPVSNAIALFRKTNAPVVLLTGNQDIQHQYVTRTDISIIEDFMPVHFTKFISTAPTAEHLQKLRDSFINALIPVIENNINPDIIFHSLSALSDAITHRIIELVIEETGPPPVPFCFISLGSEARKEQTLSTDQDNALIYTDAAENTKETAAYFENFSKTTCAMLHTVGYNFCKGNIMAMNPEWCQPIGIWKKYFSKWINKGNAKDLLDINIFFDIRPVYGDFALVSELKQHIFNETKNNPAYLYQLTQITLSLKPQVGFWGNIQLETAGAPPETVHIKEAIMPVVNFARIYALKYQLPQTGTADRLRLLYHSGVLPQSTYTNIIQAFDYLNGVRLRHQSALIKNKLKPDNLLNTNTLSDLDKTIIKKVLSHINGMLNKLSYDFKGSA